MTNNRISFRWTCEEREMKRGNSKLIGVNSLGLTTVGQFLNADTRHEFLLGAALLALVGRLIHRDCAVIGNTMLSDLLVLICG